MVGRRVAGGNLVPLHRGVYAVGHGLVSRRGEWMAAVLACGPGAYLSHGSAAVLWDIRGFLGKPEVTRRSGGSPHPSIVVHQTRILEEAETAVADGIPVTSVERTLLDIASRLDERQLERAVVAAMRAGRVRWSELTRLTQRTPRRAGTPRLRRVAARVDPRAAATRSPTEIDFLSLCRRAGLSPPEVNVLVEGHLVDFLWPRERVVVETDSFEFHADRPSFERDHLRTMDLEAAGYQVHRATYGILTESPETFLEIVRRSLRSRRAST
jgi:hypothetical protein